MTSAPIITTDRLTLRGHVMQDIDAFWDFYQSPRAQYMDAPNNHTHLWYGLASEVGSWDLMGMGAWAIEVDGALAGQVAISQPPHFDEPELGFILFEAFEGRGLAYEAAQLALEFARETLKPASLVSYIHTENARSIKLAKQLGGRHDPTGKSYAAPRLVYRYEVAA